MYMEIAHTSKISTLYQLIFLDTTHFGTGFANHYFSFGVCKNLSKSWRGAKWNHFFMCPFKRYSRSIVH